MAIVDPTTPGELWYPIPSLPGYEFSSEFRVRSFRYKGEAPRRLTAKPRFLAIYKAKIGYLMFHARVEGKAKLVYLHHVVAELAYGAVSGVRNHIRHLDDNKLNNYTSNIAQGTAGDNREDARRNRTMLIGSRHPLAILTEDDVRDIRRKLASGVRNKEIVKEYGLASSSVTYIRKRKTWKHVV